ncbi:M3 family metallopeptidase [Brasilonema bromeliae]
MIHINTQTLPCWDMSGLYPDIESAEFTSSLQVSIKAIDEFEALCNQYHVGYPLPTILDKNTVARLEKVLVHYNETLETAEPMHNYLRCLMAVDSFNQTVRKHWSTFQVVYARLSLLKTRFSAWLGSLDITQLIADSPLAQEYSFVLRQSQKQSQYQMSAQEESLAAELQITGSQAWLDLYNQLTRQRRVLVEIDGETRSLLPTEAQQLGRHHDREIRRRTYEAEIASWEQLAVPLAASLNSIKGETLTLVKRRGLASPLEIALNRDHINQTTLDAMLIAVREALPDFRRYLHIRAKVLGLPILAWYDRGAILNEQGEVWSWKRAVNLIIEQFTAYSPQLGQMAERAFRDKWIDALPRAGKDSNGFCLPQRGDESRILVNYTPVFKEVSTLAHELGHAYHYMKLAQRPMLQRTPVPLTLAETASIFCETLVRQGALLNTNKGEQINILDAYLSSACNLVVDVYSVFTFEQRLFEQRKHTTLSVDALNQMMLTAQQEAYGDGLDSNMLFPYQWGRMLLYYIETFYNYPYTFGLLFGLGLYACYKAEPESFRTKYDDLLTLTGMDCAAELAARFNINICTPDFWRLGLNLIQQDIERFQVLVS